MDRKEENRARRLAKRLWVAQGAAAATVMALLFNFPAQANGQDPAIAACVDTGAENGVPVEILEEPGFFKDADGRTFLLADAGGLTEHPDNAGGLTAYPAAPENRWGLVPAWIVQTGADGGAVLLQADVLARGLAYFMPQHAKTACTDALLVAETRALKEKRGIWRKRKVLSTRRPEAILEEAGRYVLVEGPIVSLGKTRNTRYLNFGSWWKTDFTATLRSRDQNEFAKRFPGLFFRETDPDRPVARLRGVIQIWDGPHIELTHPGQLELVGKQRNGM